MKYLVIVYDGMADRPLPALEGKTPLMAAKTPMMDSLTPVSLCGTVSNVPEGMVPESDTANLAILSYDPKVFSKGRSPLEAVSMGIDMKPDETAYRCNVVTLSEEEENYEDKRILDHSADEISTAEANELIKALEAVLGNDTRKFHTGISYRHCMIKKNGTDRYPFSRPHDLIGQRIGAHLPCGPEGEEFLELMKESYKILNHHPVNEARRARGLRPANSAWFWSPGKKPALPSFKEKFGLDATVISAVDLIKGIGLCAKMESVDVEGATGNVHTNYKGKADAAIDAFARGKDLVYVHVEGPDECGHRGEIENKILSIESIDGKILSPVVNYLRESGEPFRVMCLPDHPTPIEIRTHSMEPVPFFIYDSEKRVCGPAHMDEESAAAMGLYIADGTRLMDLLLAK